MVRDFAAFDIPVTETTWHADPNGIAVLCTPCFSKHSTQCQMRSVQRVRDRGRERELHLVTKVNIFE